MCASFRVGRAIKLPSDSQRRLVNPYKTKNRCDVAFPSNIAAPSLPLDRTAFNPLLAVSAIVLALGNPRQERRGVVTSRGTPWPTLRGYQGFPARPPAFGHQTEVPAGTRPPQAGRRPSADAQDAHPSPRAVPRAHSLGRKGRALRGGFARAPRYHSDPGRAGEAGVRAPGCNRGRRLRPHCFRPETPDPGSAPQVSAGESARGQWARARTDHEPCGCAWPVHLPLC